MIPSTMDQYNNKIMKAMPNVATYPRMIIYGVLIAVVAGWLVVSAFQRFKQPRVTRANTPDLEKPAARAVGKFRAPERPPGGMIHGFRYMNSINRVYLVWIPMDFKRPAAKPYPNWDVHTTPPLPYRPFRHGPYVRGIARYYDVY